MTTFSQSSGHTLVMTGESFPLSVPTNLLRLISPGLSSLLSLPPCLSTSLIIPDTNTSTLSGLLDLLQTGATTQQVSSESLEQLAKILDIPSFSLSPSGHTTVLTEELIMPDLKAEEDDSFSCEICFKAFNSQLPLGFHYCKHFYAELQRFEMSDIVDRQRCKKCDRNFPTQKAMVCHVGVRHNLLNKVLRSKGIQEIDFGGSDNTVTTLEGKEKSNCVEVTETEVTADTDITIVTDSEPDNSEKSSENEERVCGVCSEDFSSESLSSLILHYCDHFSEHLPSKLRRFYSGNSCSLCNKVFSVQSSLLSHIAVRHTKINMVLRAFNIAPIHFPKKQMVLRSKMSATNSVPVVPDEEPEDVKNVKISKYHCLVCGKGDEFLQNLGVHMSNIHFHQDLKLLMGPGNSCTICDKTFKAKQMALSHIGISHGHLDQLLEKKGLPTYSSLKSRKSVGNNGADVAAVPRRKSRSRRCQLCGKEEENLSLLKVHLVLKHFLPDIKARYKSLYDEGMCLLCSKPYPSTSIWQHIGCVHNKLDEILLDNGLSPLHNTPANISSGEEVLVKTEETNTEDPLEEISDETDYREFENMFVEMLQ